MKKPYLIGLTTKYQKFASGSVVKVNDFRDRLISSGYAIVVGSTAQLNSCYKNNPSYSLVIKKDDKWIRISWYDEEVLEQVTDVKLCKELEEHYLNYVLNVENI